MQPIKVFDAPSGTNPPKVKMILEELGLPYEVTITPFEQLKQKPFTDINPNGRVPAIHDPNTDTTLWESGAIILYLIETYDKDHKLSYADTKSRHQLQQWLAFQISGQGPYFGQAGWFLLFHHEKVQSAIDRYLDEIKRVVGVLDAHLATQSGPYLVGDKVTYADLSFVVYNALVPKWFAKAEKDWNEDEFPHFKAWQKGMLERPLVAKVFKEALAAAGES